MSERSALRRGAGLVLAMMMTVAFVRAGSGPLPQADDKTCFVCHDDPELKSADFAASVHGQAGRGCLACHSDLTGVEDFPHVANLEAVECARCHADFARMTAGGVHGTASPKLAVKPVLCKDCHGYHDIRPSSDPRSPVHVSNRPATCGRCHEGAGANFARGRVHELTSTGLRTAPGVVRMLYKALIAVMGAFFLASIAADLLRARRHR